MDNLILTGFMGTGKTTVGRLLAERLGRAFVDTDALIVARDGRAIADIFREDGEARFRQWEAAVAEELAGQRGLVIATGGRLMLDPDNAAALGQTGPVFCLAAAPETILARVSGDETKRPLLEGARGQGPGAREEPSSLAPGPYPLDPALARIERLLQQRAAAYARFRAVDTEGRTPGEVAGAIAAALAGGLRDVLPVRHPGGSYDVIAGENLLPEARRLSGVGDGGAAIITDSEVGPRHAARLGDGFAAVLTMPAGERHKHLGTVRDLYDGLLAAGLDRTGTVFALGGGVVGDLAGFVAATYLRGVPFVLCPTSLLAMVDASIGGKVGVDMPQGKNLVGAFAQPRAVLADVSTLATLPAGEFTAGLAEVVKHGLIADPVLWQRLLTEEWRIDPRRLGEDRLLRADLQTLLTRAIAVKRAVVEEDPYERGRRAVLNLGHTFGHAVEQVSGYTVRHGDAVAMGLVAAARLSAALEECRPTLPRLIELALAQLGLPTRIPPALDRAALFAAMGSDKKRAAGRLRFVLIRDVGEVFVRDDVPGELVLRAMDEA